MSNDTSGARLWPAAVLPLPDGVNLITSTSQWQPVEAFTVAFGCVVFFFTFLAVLVLNLARQVPYVKIIGVQFVNGYTLLFAFFWFLVLVNIKVLPSAGAFLQCNLFNLWLFNLVLPALPTCLIFRLWRLDLILNQHRAARGWVWYVPPMLLWTPTLVYSLVLQVTFDGGPYYFPQNGWVMCFSPSWAAYCLGVHFVAIVCVYITLVYRLRAARSRIFHEYHSSIVSFCLYVFAAIIYVVLIIGYGEFIVAQRVAIALIALIAGNFALWAFIARPFYNVVFRHKAASTEFKNAIQNKKIVVNDSVPNSGSYNKGSTTHSSKLPAFLAWFQVNKSSTGGSDHGNTGDVTHGAGSTYEIPREAGDKNTTAVAWLQMTMSEVEKDGVEDQIQVPQAAATSADVIAATAPTSSSLTSSSDAIVTVVSIYQETDHLEPEQLEPEQQA